MKRLLLALVIAGLFVSSAYADGMRMGSLTQQNMSEEEFAAFIKSQERSFFGWKVLNTHHRPEDTFTYYDSLTAMLMGLRSAKIDEAALPEPVAEYVVNTNPAFEISCALHSRTTYLALGFKNDDKGLRLCGMFNEALASMRADRRLSILVAEYLSTPGKSQPHAAKFGHFDGAETLKVAVTGDLPPMDIIASDGTPVGFNTAVLSEIGRRLGVNIELVSIESGARTSALTSGRVDVVFWYQVYEGVDKQPDAPEGVLLSDRYYEWDNFMHLRHFVR